MTVFINTFFIKILFVTILFSNNIFGQENPKQPAAADFTLTDTKGNTYNLYNELSTGKTVVIDFFSTSCGSCSTTLPILTNIWQNNGGQNSDVWVWGIETNVVSNSVIDTFLNHNGGDFPCFSTTQNDSVVLNYNVNFTPYFYVVCPDKRRIPSLIGEIQGNIDVCRQITQTKPIELENQTILIYSNKETLTIEIPESNGIIEIYNASGNLLQKTIVNNSTFHSINIQKNRLQAGIYFYKYLDTNNHIVTGKFIIN